MSNRITLIVLSLLLLALIGWGVYWFFDNHESRIKEIRTDLSPQARRNQFLAAERFLERIDLEAESVTGRGFLLELPDQPGLLVVNSLGVDMAEAHRAKLYQWVASGGHLVVTPPRSWDDEESSSGNTMLDQLGVRLRSETDQEDEEEPEQLQSGDEQQHQAPDKIQAFFPGHVLPVAVKFDTERWLEESTGHADWHVLGVSGFQLLQYRIGNGRITVMSDLDFLHNDAIGKEDHALFLARLAGDQRRAWLLYSSNIPNLMRLIWRNLPELFAGLLLLVGLGLWRLTRRSGPQLPETGTERRNLLEHLEAAAEYAWYSDRARNLFKNSQGAIEQEWLRRHPLLGRLERPERCQWVAERTGLAERAVEAAIYGEYADEQEFIKLSAVLQKLAAGLQIQERRAYE